LVIAGSPSDLRRVISGIVGRGDVEQVWLAWDKVELVFHGQVTVWLDKQALAASSVTTRVAMHPMYGAHETRIKIDGKTVSRSVRNPVDLPLPLSALIGLPKVSTGSQLTISCVNAKHVKQVVGVQDLGTAIRLDQRN
jgi:hypothetical protein